MNRVRNELNHYKRQLINLKTGEYYSSYDLENVKHMVDVLDEDYNQLSLFEKRVKNKEVKGYGMEI